MVAAAERVSVVTVVLKRRLPATDCRHVSRVERVKGMGCGRRDFLRIAYQCNGSAVGVKEDALVAPFFLDWSLH